MSVNKSVDKNLTTSGHQTIPEGSVPGTGKMPSSDNLPTWAIVVIIVIVLLLISAALTGTYLLIRRIRDRRRNHGEYRPQMEETLHAKNLPYISPPNIEGLI